MIRQLRLLLSFTPFLAFAVNAQTAPRWLIGNDSTLSFIAIQQGAAFEGRFEDFEGEIQFAADQLATSHLLVTVDTGSVDTDYAERDDVLRAAEFFDVMRWPEARFEARSFRALGGDAYEASGELTLRDQTHPLTVPFSFQDEGDQARLTGEVVVPRLRFGIGQGEWADTTWIGADVRVRFALTLLR
jgi:polyisoprenoid-binding protein YceI